MADYHDGMAWMTPYDLKLINHELAWMQLYGLKSGHAYKACDKPLGFGIDITS